MNLYFVKKIMKMTKFPNRFVIRKKYEIILINLMVNKWRII